MKLNLALSTHRMLLIAGLTIASLLASTEGSEAQLLKQIRTDFGTDNQIQYAPDDPSTRSRLFTLQTGHAGAFYNCDGEECKRNSPYICWKTAHGDRKHGTFWDVLQWDRDRTKIAQRICDGGCCASKTAKTRAKAACGCLACAGQSQSKTLIGKASAKSPAGAVAKSKLQLKPKANTVGLLNTNVARAKAAPKAQRITIAGATSVLNKPVACDCLVCRGKRKSVTPNGNSVAKQESSTPTVEKAPAARSASLLERARSSRQR